MPTRLSRINNNLLLLSSTMHRNDRVVLLAVQIERVADN